MSTKQKLKKKSTIRRENEDIIQNEKQKQRIPKRNQPNANLQKFK